MGYDLYRKRFNYGLFENFNNSLYFKGYGRLLEKGLKEFNLRYE